MTNYFRTIYVSSFKAPTGAIYPAETVADLRWMTAPLQPIRLPPQLVKTDQTDNRIEVTFDFDSTHSWDYLYEVPQRLPARAPSAAVVAGPVLVPSLVVSLQPQPFTTFDPIRLPPRRPDPSYGIGTFVSQWYVAPNPVETLSAQLQPIRPAVRGPQIHYRPPIQPENIREPSLWQAPVIVSPLPKRLVPQATFNVPVPPITIDAIVTRRPADPVPGRLPPRSPQPQPSFAPFAETYVITIDKWRTAPELPIRPRPTPARGGNFAPPVVPAFDVIAWWAPSPVPARPATRLTHTSFFNCGLPLPGDASTVSRVDWSKPIVIRPPVRQPHTQSSQPNFQAYDLTVASWSCPSPQPIRSRTTLPHGGSTLSPAFIGIEEPQCFTESGVPQRTAARAPAPLMQPVKIVVALDFPQLTLQPIIRQRPTLILPTSFVPPAVSDESFQRFSPALQPSVARVRNPITAPTRSVDPSLISTPVPVSWQQSSVPVRAPVRGPWCSPSAFIFRPQQVTTGFVEAGQVGIFIGG